MNNNLQKVKNKLNLSKFLFCMLLFASVALPILLKNSSWFYIIFLIPPLGGISSWWMEKCYIEYFKTRIKLKHEQ